MLRPRWKRTATVLPLVVLLIGFTLALGATSASAQVEVQHGIAFTKGCSSPTAIGNAYTCSFSIANLVDEAHDTLTISGLVDTVHSAGGDVPSGNVFGSVKLDSCSTSSGVCTQTTATCSGAGITGTGTRADPWQHADLCTLPFGSRINVQSFSHYTVLAADFGLPNHILKDSASLDWADLCNDPAGTGNSNCNPDPPPNDGATSQSVILPLLSSTATTIHDAAHNPVTSVAVGSTVHDLVTVTGQAGQAAPTGNVNVDWFLNGDCSGAPAANSGSIGPLVAGAGIVSTFDATGFAFGPLNTAGLRAFEGHYEGAGPYAASNGGCEPLHVVDANIQITPATATNEVGANHTLHCHINVNDGTGFANAPDGTTCTVTVTSGAATPATQNCSTGVPTAGSGTCDVVITSSTPGTNTIQASTTVTVGGVSLTRTTGDAHVGDGPNAHKTFVDANIQITPATATNPVGANHTLHCHINVNDGTGFANAPDGTTCTVTVTSGAATPATQNCSTGVPTAGSGTCDVVITSSTPGTNTIQASTTVTVGGVSLTRTTGDAHVGDGPNAHKTFVDANIQITPATATNPVGANHTLHCHINVNDGTGFANAPDGTTCTVTVTSGAATPATQNCSTGVPTAGSGTCDVVITSSTPGTNTIQASTTVTVGGVSLTRTTGDAHVGDGPNAHKTFVDANIQITPATATNEVGANHTLHCHINVNDGTGFANAPDGTTCTVTVTSGAATPATQNCSTGVPTAGSGTCDVVITSSTPGTNTIQASTTVDVGGVSLTRTTGDAHVGDGPNAHKTFVDANIQITPATATNPVGANHTLHCHINVNDGTGFANAPDGTTCTVTVTSGAATPATQNCSTGVPTAGSGTCDVVITSSTPGTNTIQASTTVDVGGVSLTRTTGDAHVGDGPNATKLFGDVTVTTKVLDDQNNDITGTTVNAGTIVHDQATVTRTAGTPAGVPNPTGSVTFKLYSGTGCSGTVLATDANEPLGAGGVATSATFTTPTTAGSFSYLAHYNGDANYPAKDAGCEPFQTTHSNVGALTIGFWKTHAPASCKQGNGNQSDNLTPNLGLPTGITLGTYHLTDPCKAVQLLSKNNINGVAEPGDPIFNMVAQLVGVYLNLNNGSGTCAALNTALASAQSLLTAINFNGVTYTMPLTAAQSSTANSLNTTFDSYNNGTLAGC